VDGPLVNKESSMDESKSDALGGGPGIQLQADDLEVDQATVSGDVLAQIPSTRHSLLVESHRGWAGFGLGEIWAYRELVYFFIWREVLLRYKQTVLGVGWVIIQPVVMMVIFTVIFGGLARLPSDGVPYPVFTFAGLLPWQLFAGALQRGGTSLVENANLITKVYFPRLALPLAAVLAGLVDFAVSFVVLLLLMLYYGVAPTAAIVWLPLLVLLALTTAIAVSLWLSALNVLYRDVKHSIPFLVQAWMYASPVAYSANLIPSGKWRLIYGLNPMTEG